MKSQKIKKLFERLQKLQEDFDASTNVELSFLTQEVVSKEMQGVGDKVKKDTVVQWLTALNKKLDSFKEDSAFDSVVSKIEEFKKEVTSVQSSLVADNQIRDKEIEQSFRELKTEISDIKDDTLTEVSQKLDVLEQNIKTQLELKEQQANLLQITLQEIDTRLSEAKKQGTLDLEKLRQDFLTLIANQGGGAQNQKISVNGTVMSTKYADINLKGTITKTDNDTTKEVDITFAGGASIGGDVTGGTDGSVLFIHPSGTLAQDNTNFFWDDSNNRLGIGTNAPSSSLDVNGNVTLSNNSPILYFSNDGGVADDSPIIKWKSVSGLLGLKFYSDATLVGRFQDNGALVAGKFSTIADMHVGDYFIQRGGGPKITLGDSGSGDPTGQIDAGGDTSSTGYNGTWMVLMKNASIKGLIVKGAASQSANLQEWQTSAGVARGYVNSSFDTVLASPSGNSQDSSKFTTIGTNGAGTQQTYSMRAAWDGAYCTGQWGSTTNYISIRQDTSNILFYLSSTAAYVFTPTGIENMPGLVIGAYRYQDWLGTQQFLVFGGTGMTANTPTASVHANTINGATDLEMFDIGNAPYNGDASGAIHYGIRLRSSTTSGRLAATWKGEWATSTDASRKARATLTVWDTAEREGLRIEASGSAPMIGFLGASAVAQQSGDIGTGLVNLGLFSSATKTPKTLFDHYTDVGNVGTGEDDLYSDTLSAGILGTNGDKIEAEYGGVFVSSATATRQIRMYFGGTLIFDTGALSLSLSAAWTAYVTCIRVSSSVVRCMISLTTEGAALAAYTAYTEVTGLTLANTQILKITAEAAGVGAATDDIVAKMGSVSWIPAA